MKYLLKINNMTSLLIDLAMVENIASDKGNVIDHVTFKIVHGIHLVSVKYSVQNLIIRTSEFMEFLPNHGGYPNIPEVCYLPAVHSILILIMICEE